MSEPPTAVVCFDRDLTVDVNPPSFGRAVPLAWVKELAHGPTTAHVDVWATGNQHLRAEAAIPGMREAKRIWEAQRGRSCKGTYPPLDRVEPPKYKPRRRDGLTLIRECYAFEYGDVMPEFIVVDDADLTDLEGYRYYYPHEFAIQVDMNGAGLGFRPTLECDEPAQSNACTCELELTDAVRDGLFGGISTGAEHEK